MRSKKNRIYKRRSRKQKGGNNIIYIKKSNRTEADALDPIFKILFNEDKIEYTDDISKASLAVAYNRDDAIDIPYIGFVGEHKDNIDSTILNDKSLINLVGTQEESILSLPNTYYFPNFLYVGPTNKTMPYEREYINNERPFTAAYIASHSPLHREEMFNALRKLDSTVDGLGIANHTKDVVLPQKWWDLPSIYKDYKFGFAMENKNENGYITEKIMNVFRGGAIPLYWGTSKVKEIFNPESFIYLNDYESLDKAAEDIIRISKDNSLLKKYQEAAIFNKNYKVDYYNYYMNPPPQWLYNITSKIYDNLYKAKERKKEFKAFVVNLDKRTDRWENIQTRFKSYPFELERVSAVIHEKPYAGCTLSYQKVIQMAKDKNMESVLIFEDDNDPFTDFVSNWRIIKKWLDENLDKWDIFNGSPRIEYYDTVKVKYNLDNNIKLLISNLILNGNFLYFNKKIYDKILNFKVDDGKNSLSVALDRFIGDSNNFNMLFSYPFLSFQQNDFSDTLSYYDDKTNDHQMRLNKIKEIVEKDIQNGGNSSISYVINLPKNVERWNTIQKNFKDSSIKLVQFLADENMNEPAKGLASTFIRLVEMAKNNNMSTLLFFEDDTKPLDNFDKRWNITKKWLDDNMGEWEVFNGGPRTVDWYPFDAKVKIKLEENVNLLEPNYFFAANWIYLNSSVFDKILSEKDNIYHIDQYLSNLKKIVIYPFLGSQENGYSNLEKKERNFSNWNSKIESNFKKILNKSGGKRKTKKKKQKGGNTNLILRSHDGGFFSNFNKLIAYLKANNDITKITFDVKSLGSGTASGFLNKNNELFSKLFEPYDENVPIIKELIVDEYKENLEITGTYAAQFYGNNRNNLQPYNNVFTKYIKLKKELQEKIDLQIDTMKKMNVEQIIAIFIRNKALAYEQPKGKMPRNIDYENALNKIDKTKKTGYFFCIDNEEDLEYFKNKYSPYYYTKIRRSKTSMNTEAHRASNGSMKDLEDSYIEVALLSKCDILAHCLSNMVTASLYMNMNQESIFVENNE
jgi:hypothetical protein